MFRQISLLFLLIYSLLSLSIDACSDKNIKEWSVDVTDAYHYIFPLDNRSNADDPKLLLNLQIEAGDKTLEAIDFLGPLIFKYVEGKVVVNSDDDNCLGVLTSFVRGIKLDDDQIQRSIFNMHLNDEERLYSTYVKYLHKINSFVLQIDELFSHPYNVKELSSSLNDRCIDSENGYAAYIQQFNELITLIVLYNVTHNRPLPIPAIVLHLIALHAAQFRTIGLICLSLGSGGDIANMKSQFEKANKELATILDDLSDNLIAYDLSLAERIRAYSVDYRHRGIPWDKENAEWYLSDLRKSLEGQILGDIGYFITTVGVHEDSPTGAKCDPPWCVIATCPFDTCTVYVILTNPRKLENTNARKIIKQKFQADQAIRKFYATKSIRQNTNFEVLKEKLRGQYPFKWNYGELNTILFAERKGNEVYCSLNDKIKLDETPFILTEHYDIPRYPEHVTMLAFY